MCTISYLYDENMYLCLNVALKANCIRLLDTEDCVPNVLKNEVV